MPRPKLPPGKKKVDAVQLRLSEPDREAFNRLRTDVQETDLRGVIVTDAGLLRWLFAKELAARGLDKPAPEVPKASRSSAPKGKAGR